MDRPLSKEESYAERRQLFKDIWEAALNINEKEYIMNKPKVIKTLRLDQVDRYAIGNTKKQRIKNLRHVCNKILDFCDRQDADDIIYEQMVKEGQKSPRRRLMKTRKQGQKTQGSLNKKVIKSKSLSSPPNDTLDPRTINSDRKKDDLIKPFMVSRNTSPIKRTALKKSILGGKSLKPKPSPKKAKQTISSNVEPKTEGTTRRKVLRKKRVKRKKSLEHITYMAQPGGIHWPDI